MPSLVSPWHPSSPITRSHAIVAVAHSLGTPSLCLVSTISLFTFSHHLHVAFASIPCISSSPITYRLNLHSPSHLTTPPSIHVFTISYPSLELSTSAGHSNSYNLHSRVSHPPEHVGIGLISPPKITKLPRGRHSYISKDIIQARVDVAHGRQYTLDRVLKASNTLPQSHP